MIIDFVKVIGENPIGLDIHIDSLVIQSGYFQYKKENVHCINRPFDDCWVISKTSNYIFDLLISDKRRSIEKYEKDQSEEWEKLRSLTKPKKH